MKQNSKSIELIRIVAQALGDLNDVAVFIGGSTLPFYIPEVYWPQARVTEDVDIVLEVVGRLANWKTDDALRKKGFVNDISEDAPICRWVYDGWLKVDIMNSDERVLGFTNKWYNEGISKSTILNPPFPKVKVFTFPYFLATKLEAFEGRGNNDYRASPDMEDIISILEVYPKENIKNNLDNSSNKLREYLYLKLNSLLKNSDFIDALNGSVFNRVDPNQGVEQVMKTTNIILKLVGLS